MDVVLIDRMGVTREMAVDSPFSVRVPKVQAYALASVVGRMDQSRPISDAVEFRDSGLVDDSERPILTPDGKDVPLGKFQRPVFRRGRQAYANIILTDEMRHHSRVPVETLVLEGTRPMFAGMTDARMQVLKWRETERHEGIGATEYSVLAEERIQVTA